MTDHGATDGERLCNHLHHQVLKTQVGNDLAEALRPTGRAEDLVDFYRQIGAVTLTQRIVKAGTSFADVGLDDPQFKIQFKSYLREIVGISPTVIDSVYRFSERAVAAANETFTNGIQRRMREWSEQRHPYCYMCGRMIDFGAKDIPLSYTCEHVWPRSYGGNSDIENLLPACLQCNNELKSDFTTCVMPPIHSFVLGIGPSDENLARVPREYKFALHYRAAQRLASEKRQSLKKSFLEIGPWKPTTICQGDDVVDFFNLQNVMDI